MTYDVSVKSTEEDRLNKPNASKNDQQTVSNKPQEPSYGRAIYSVFHTMMSIAAIYLSFKCNKGFNFLSFLLACCCPYIYIIYTLATKGLCDNIDKDEK